jgi:CHAT domain-containing protein
LEERHVRLRLAKAEGHATAITATARGHDATTRSTRKERLSDYRILHFATHGALAGQVKGSTEPGLILTPPPKGTTDPQSIERDDGYLAASEIAGLKLDANLVIMAGCNTAGPSGETAEALSGVAQAFFYAGARALLVSHWFVDTDAKVKLITQMTTYKSVGRSEALRRSMVKMIDDGEPIEVTKIAHQATSPFQA